MADSTLTVDDADQFAQPYEPLSDHESAETTTDIGEDGQVEQVQPTESDGDRVCPPAPKKIRRHASRPTVNKDIVRQLFPLGEL